ncbi:MAG: MFS transporter [Sphingobacteriales bacterium JAD_PAG50586_3]|nr:MAG: MFS transporter [Sphingobacteriales bacterium JAD_PAG50586_3]
MKRSSPIFVLFFTIFIDLLGFGIIIPILGPYAKDVLHADGWVYGLIFGVYSFMNFVFAPVLGTLSDRKGRRPVLLITIVIAMVGHLLFSFSSSLILLFIARMIAGIGSANISVANAYISDVTPPEGRAKAMGLIGAAFGLGFVFGPPVGGYIYEHLSFEYIGYLTAGLCLINFVLAWIYLPESIKERNTENKFNFKNILNGLIEAGQNPKVNKFFVLFFIVIIAFSMMQSTVTLLFKDRYSLTASEGSYMFAYVGFLMAIVQGFFIGFFSKRLGESKMLLIGSIGMGLGLALIPFGPFYMQFIYFAIIAVSNGMIGPAINSLISKNADPTKLGQIMGANQSFGSLSRGLGPIIAGVLYDINYTFPYLAAGLIMTVCFFTAFVVVKRPEGR